MARWYEPRLRHAGTHNEAWRNHRYPLPPEDFDPRFYQSAHPDLISRQHLTGEEPLTLSGLLPDGPRSMRLPGVYLLARARTGERPAARRYAASWTPLASTLMHAAPSSCGAPSSSATTPFATWPSGR
jgi:hypothetical protein